MRSERNRERETGRKRERETGRRRERQDMQSSTNNIMATAEVVDIELFKCIPKQVCTQECRHD